MTVIDLSRWTSPPPREHVFPDYGTSAGQEAIELAASAGLLLDPWQQDLLRHSLGERADGGWTATEVGLIVARQQGKGVVLEARELAGLVLFGERLIMHTAHELKTAMMHFKRLLNLFDGNDDLRKRVAKVINSNGKEGITMANGAELQCIARSKGSGRGFSGDLVVLDEAYALTPAQMEATMPTMLARSNPQVWYTSSPPLDAASGAVLFSVRDRAKTGASEGQAWFDYGIEGTLDRLDEINLDDRELWKQALPAYAHGRVTERAVQKMRDLLPTDEGFAREILGMWPPGLGESFQIISSEDWQEALHLGSTIEGPYVLAAAVSVDRSRSSIAACGRNAEGKLHVEITSTPIRTDSRNGTGWVVSRMEQIASKRKPLSVVMDDFGPTGSLIPAWNGSETADRLQLEVTPMGTAAMAKAYGMFYDAVSGADRASRDLAHIGQPELTEAVANAQRRPLGDGWAWDRRTPTADVSPLVAATSAVYGWMTRPEDDGAFNIW